MPLIIPALDLDTELEVKGFLSTLPDVKIAKIDCLWRDVVDSNPKIEFFVDEKFFDIPNTVERKVRRLTAYSNISMCTVHAERNALMAALNPAKGTNLKILAVCLLTSMSGQELKEYYNYNWMGDPGGFVLERVKMAIKLGCHGTICSAQEVKAIREIAPEGFLIVVPGTQSDKTPHHDHKRTGSPRQAISDGATHLVIGRQILNAENPRQAFDDLVVEIS